MTLPDSSPKRRLPISPRVLTALIGLPIVVGIVQIGGWFLVGVALFLSLLAMRELVVSTRQSSTRIETLSFLLLIGLFYTLLFSDASSKLSQIAPTSKPTLGAPLAAVILASLIVAVLAYATPRKISLLPLSLSVFASLYISLFAFIPVLQSQTNGRALLWLTLLGVWTGDTIAYYAGRRFGKTKLTPLSPGKSREGALAGFIATILMSVLVASIAHLGIGRGVVLGVCLGIAAPLGDLAESFWKRELGVKDLGTILPGHGGVLDRCDSLLFAAPTVYFVAKLLGV